MPQAKTFALAAALTLSVSGLALAQATAPAPSPTAPSTAAPSTGIAPTTPGTAPSSSATTPGSTAGSGSTMMTEADVRQKLEQEGYSQISDLKKDKDGYTAKGMKGGKQVTLGVDATGKVEAK
jgi:hypothetical protein